MSPLHSSKLLQFLLDGTHLGVILGGSVPPRGLRICLIEEGLGPSWFWVVGKVSMVKDK